MNLASFPGLIYHKNRIYVNWKGKMYHFTWLQLFYWTCNSKSYLWDSQMNHLLVWYTIRITHTSIGMVKYTISLDRDFFWKNNSKYYLWDYEMNHFLVSYTMWIVQTNNKKSKMYHFTWQRLFNQNVIVNITFEIVKWAIWQLEFLECTRKGN